MKPAFASSLAAVILVPLALTGATYAAGLPDDLRGARFVYDSDRDIAKDGAPAVYLWEGGRTVKLFVGAIGPRWSPDGDRIACILALPGKKGTIAVLDRAGKIRIEIPPREAAEAVEWLDGDTLIYAAREERRAQDTRRTLLIRHDMRTASERILYATQASGEIYQLNWNRGRDRLIIDIMDRFPGEQDLMRRTAVLDAKDGGALETVYDRPASRPALSHDDETLVFQTDLDVQGKPAAKAGEGALAAFNIRSGEWAPIRRAHFVHNTRFSDNGRYFYSAEAEGETSVSIRVFSIEDMDTPVLRVSRATGILAEPHKDLRPDLFMPGTSWETFDAPAAIHGVTGVDKPVVHTNVAGGQSPQNALTAAPHSRGTMHVMPDKGYAPKTRGIWSADPHRPLTRGQLPAEPAETMPKLSANKVYEPLQTSENARQGMIVKEATPSTAKLSANKPYDPLMKAVDARQEMLHKEPPPWFRVPDGATAVDHGWIVHGQSGMTVKTIFNEDYTSLTMTTKGPNIDNTVTYPVTSNGVPMLSQTEENTVE